MRTLLLFPPHCLPYQPWSTLPSLKAYLRSQEVELAQRDLNIEIYHLLLTSEYLSHIADKIKRVLSTFEAKQKLSASEQKRFLETLEAYAVSKDVIEEVEEAKKTFRDPTRFYNFSSLSRAKEVLENAFGMISMAYYPGRITREYFVIDYGYADLNSLIKATQDKKTNPFIEIFDTHIIDSLMEWNPQVIGISLSLQEQILPGLTLSRMLKRRSPQTHVVLGGYVITRLTQRLKELPEFFQSFTDYAIVGEGEKPLLDLVRAIEAGSDLRLVPSLMFRNKDRVQLNPLCAYIGMNDLPTPDYDGFPLESYLSPTPILSLGTSRGCYWGKCAFCDRGKMSGIKYRKRQTNKVVDELEYLSKTYGTRYFNFTDEAVAPSFLEQISEEIYKRNLRLWLSTDARFENKFTPELCRKISKAGFIELRFGLESASDRVLTHMRKGTNRETIRKVIKNFSGAGVCIHLYVFFGFPSESKTEAQQTIDFVVHNNEYIDSACPTTFGLVEHSPAFVYPDRFGIDNIDYDPGKLFKFFFDFGCGSGMSTSEANEMEKKFSAEMRKAYKDFTIWGNLEWGHKLLYHAKYGHKGLLRLVETKKQNESEDFSYIGDIDVAFVPKLIDQILYYESQYNLAEIAENVRKGIKKEAERRKSQIIYDHRNYQVISVNQHAAEIIKLLDGIRNIEQISAILADRYSTSPRLIQEIVVPFLDSLQRQGILFDVRTTHQQDVHFGAQ